MADDFESGTRSAVIARNSTVLTLLHAGERPDTPGSPQGVSRKAEGKCYTDVAFHLVITDPTAEVLGQELPALVAAGYTSLKVFMTYEGLRLRDDQILDTLDAARRTGALVMVHCENEDAIAI